jgi:hypothetical protein
MPRRQQALSACWCHAPAFGFFRRTAAEMTLTTSPIGNGSVNVSAAFD